MPVVCCLQSFTGSALAALVKGLPEALQRQYEYEDPIVRGGKQLLHSPFFKVRPLLFFSPLRRLKFTVHAVQVAKLSASVFQVLVALACDLELDTLPCCAETHKWAWFRRYCTASRVAVALDKRTSLPRPFLDEVRVPGGASLCQPAARVFFSSFVLCSSPA